MLTGIIPGTLKYVEGDATLPMAGGHRILVHICNDVGAFGAGFAKAVAEKWPAVRNDYKLWYRSQNDFKQGSIQPINVKSDLMVVNMIAQEGLISKDNPTPVNHESVKQCLNKVMLLAKSNGSSVHMPRIGTGLGGSSWNQIEPIIIESLVNKGINVTVYDLDQEE